MSDAEQQRELDVQTLIDAQSARLMTRRLLDRELVPSEMLDAGAVAATRACERVCRDLARSLGRAGTHALLSRALSQAQAEVPLLLDVHVSASPASRFEGVDEAIAARGSAEVALGLEMVLQMLLILLGRLLGPEMVVRLIEHGATGYTLPLEDGE